MVTRTINQLRDRHDKVTMPNGDIFELCIEWNRDDLKRSCFGIPPEYAHIHKNGKLYAYISVYSNIEDISIKAYHELLVKPEWERYLIGKDINRIPFKDILKELPLDWNSDHLRWWEKKK